MVILTQGTTVHEMLCMHFADEFDNRMLQMKKQLRGNRVGFWYGFSAAILKVY
jgi:hypothetical protein